MSLSEQLRDLFAKDWDWEMKDNPEFASQAGVHDVQGKFLLQDVSPEGYQARAEHSKRMAAEAIDILMDSRGKTFRREQLATMSEEEKESLQSGHFKDLWNDCEGQLSDDEILYAELFKTMHEECARNIDSCKMYLLPLNSMGVGGVLNSFIDTVEQMRFETTADFEIYLAKLGAFHIQIDSFILAMREGIRTGMVASAEMIRLVEAQVDDLIASDLPALREPLSSTTLDLDDGLRSQIYSAIHKTKEGFTKFKEFFRSEYTPKVRSITGCSALPNGLDMYQACLRYHTTTGLTPDQVHAIGLAEVAAIEARYVSDVLVPLGYKKDQFKNFIADAQMDSKYHVENPADLKRAYEVMCSAIAKILPDFFNEFPNSPLSIETRTAGPAAYYLAGTADGKRPGRFYVNIGNISEKPLYETAALALHEAIPGHHHQCSIALENEKLPMFLRCCEDRRYEVCPARRNMYTAYIEGWALYCEYLGEEMGMYKTPHDIFGRLSMDMMRAVRLVVDTGIHAKGWTIEQSVTYMMEKTGMSSKEVEKEIYRYETWPGQATAYKIGQLEILRLRRKAETELEDLFNIRDFHSVCLNSGPVPLSILEELVLKYIENKKDLLRKLMEG